MTKKYDHAISFNFTLKTDSEFPTGGELLDALEKAVNNPELNEDNITDSLEVFDTYVNED